MGGRRLMQQDRGPYKKEMSCGQRLTQNQDSVWTWRQRWGDAPASPGTPRTPAKPQKLEGGLDQILRHSLQRCSYLDLGLPISRQQERKLPFEPPRPWWCCLDWVFSVSRGSLPVVKSVTSVTSEKPPLPWNITCPQILRRWPQVLGDHPLGRF